MNKRGKQNKKPSERGVECLVGALLDGTTRRRFAIATFSDRTSTDDASMDGARHAVDHLDEQLRKSVRIIDRGVLDITLTTLIHNVAHRETFNRLVLRHATTTVDAVQITHVTASLVAPAGVTTLLRHSKLKTYSTIR